MSAHSRTQGTAWRSRIDAIHAWFGSEAVNHASAANAALVRSQPNAASLSPTWDAAPLHAKGPLAAFRPDISDQPRGLNLAETP